MANERNKILPYALSAIEGVNIQSQEDYSASSETTDGVSTGLANGNNFNKLAKQVSIMSSSLAEFIVNTLSEQTISDTNSIEEISSALNNAILKLIKDNEPVIPDKAGITVIDDNITDITSFNQITEDGIYYIYKQLSDGPSQNGEAIKYGFIHLIVINVSIAAQNFDMCMQMTSFGTFPYYIIPGNIGSLPMLRSYNKTSKQWADWSFGHGITFINNNIVISDFTIDKLHTKFPIIATDNTFPNGFNTFMYSATKAQMREKLGIADQPDLTDYFNKKTDKIDLASQVIGQLKNSNISDNAITDSKIASLAITADKLASSSITNAKIANGAVTSEKIASKTITAGNIADNTITANQIAANAITSSELASNTVTNAKISNGAVTDEKFSGALSVAKGGTGTTDGFGWENVFDRNKFFNKIGFTAGGTTQEFIRNIPSGTNVYIKSYFSKTELSDIPRDKGTISVITLDANTKILKLYAPYNYEEWLYTTKNNVGNGWIKTRNDDGTIPAEIISPTVLTYTNDQGTWTETKLSDGTKMLNGKGTKAINVKTNTAFTINFPKQILTDAQKRKSSILMKQPPSTVGWSIPVYTNISTNALEGRILCENYPSDNTYVEFVWSIEAILQS